MFDLILAALHKKRIKRAFWAAVVFACSCGYNGLSRRVFCAFQISEKKIVFWFDMPFGEAYNPASATRTGPTRWPRK